MRMMALVIEARASVVPWDLLALYPIQHRVGLSWKWWQPLLLPGAQNPSLDRRILLVERRKSLQMT